jgi:alpha-tubulin suppressor-like RCC1 family protein
VHFFIISPLSFRAENNPDQATQYLRKFIVNFSIVATPLHAITSKGNIFHWGNTQQRVFEYLKKKINDAPVLAMPNL